MFLSKPALPVAIQPEDAKKIVEELVSQKGWRDFELGKPELSYVPYWFFGYDALMESAAEIGEQGEEVSPASSEAQQGNGAMNAFSGDFDEGIASISIEEAGKERSISHKFEFEAIRPRVREADARRIITLRLASELQTKKENIVVSALEMVFVPVWNVSVSLNENTHNFSICASDGTLLGGEELPERQRPRPFGAISGILGAVANSSALNYIAEQLRTNKRLQVAILVIILALILLNELKIIRIY